MAQQTTDVVLGCLADLSVALLVPKKIGVTFLQALMGVHPGAIIAEDRFGHEGGCFAVLSGYVADQIFVVHDAIGHLRQRRILHVDLALSGRAHLMVMDLSGNTYFFHLQDDLRADVLERVSRWRREIPFLVSQLIA